MVRLLLVDNGTKHLDELVTAIKGLGVSFDNLKYSKVNEEELDKYDMFVLSGRVGGGILVDRNNLKVLKYALKSHKKLLGICFGAHIIAMSFGGTLNRLKDIRVGIHDIDGSSIPFFPNHKMNVFSRHRYVISNLPDNLLNVARSSECQFEVVRTKDSLVYGTQFHPEKTDDGLKFFNAFFSI